MSDTPPNPQPMNGQTLDEVYFALATDWSLWQLDEAPALQRITETLAGVLQVKRASIWRLEGEAPDATLRSLDLYQASQGHSGGVELAQADYPAYFRALNQGRFIDAEDAEHDPRTREFARHYLQPLGIGAMLDATIRQTGQTYGVVCIEHVGGTRHWHDDEQRFLLSVSDLISQLLLYQATRDSEQRYRQLFNHAGDAIFIMDEDRFVDCNPKTLEIYGCSRADIIGSPPYLFSPPQQPDGRDSTEKALQLIDSALAGQQQQFEWRHIRLDGTPFDAEVTLVGLQLKNRPHLMAVVRDITRRKQAEAALRESETKLRRHAAHLGLLTDLAAQLHQAQDIEQVARQTLASLAQLSHAPSSGFLELEPDTRQLRVVATRGFETIDEALGHRLELTGTLTAIALADRQIVTSHDLHTDSRASAPVHHLLRTAGYHSTVVIPLLQGDEPLGALFLGFHDHYKPDETELEILNTVGRTVSLAMTNIRHMDTLAYRASHDSLTQLPNREALHQDCERRIAAMDSGQPCWALCLLDLNRFKEINDSLGHQIGDQALQHVAEQLREAATRLPLTPYRLGGDEFAILIHGQPDDDHYTDIAGAVLEAVRRPFRNDTVKLELSGTLGIAYYSEHASNSHELLRCADVAMYAAKAQTSSIQVYTPSLDTNTPERLALMAELGTAIRDDQLLLHFQPKVDLQRQTVTGCEALVRWQHPTLGMVPPDKFIPLAEMSDLIHPLTSWVMAAAIAALQRLRQHGFDLQLAANLSMQNLGDQNCTHDLARLLQEHPVDPGSFELEITESALMRNPALSLQQAERLRGLGIRLSVDDFGTGHSSLANLKRLQPHTLKIDRSFISDMLEDDADVIIVRSTIALAHGLGLSVVAEGIEDQPTLERLREMGCDQAQGYHIARPMPEAELVDWLRSGHWNAEPQALE